MKIEDVTGVEIYMGKPGSGKSTMAAILASDYLKKGITVYSNYPINGCRKLDLKKDIMKYNIEHALILIDEAGLEHDSREFKTFSKEMVIFYKTHRHYHLRICLFTQFWDDVDKKIRVLTNKIFVVTPTILFWNILCKEVSVYIGISDDKQIVEQFEFKHFLSGGLKYRYKYKARKLFDSWEKTELPEKTWDTWSVQKPLKITKRYLVMAFLIKKITKIKEKISKIRRKKIECKEGKK